MSQARNVSADFVRLIQLEVTVIGPGVVSSSEPNRILCRSVCASEYDAGTQVTLEATAKSGYWFLGWSGACSGTGTCTVTMNQANTVHARFARELQLRLQVPSRSVYHQPHEWAMIRALATWRGKPLAGARIVLLITCPGRRSTAVLTTGKDGRVFFVFGEKMRNALRVYTCKVRGNVTANRRTARAEKPGIVHFIHPLWLETQVTNGKIVARIWGRAREPVQLFADGKVVGRARIGRNGWVEITSAEIHHGSMLWVTGPNGHTSHVITA